jgi:hypothetical protein
VSGVVLPDYYRDTGCSVHPKCLECPLPVCRFDLPNPQHISLLRQARNKTILDLHHQGKTVRDIARTQELTEGLVYRVVQVGTNLGLDHV